MCSCKNKAPLFNTAIKDKCAINIFEKLHNIFFSEVYCSHFGFATLLFSATTTDMSPYEVLNLFPHWPLVFRSLLLPLLVACDVATPLSQLGVLVSSLMSTCLLIHMCLASVDHHFIISGTYLKNQQQLLFTHLSHQN